MPDARTLSIQYYFDVVGEPTTAIELPLGAGAVKVGRPSPESIPDIPIHGGCRSASRQHAVVESQKGSVTLTDQSRFGTVVNGKVVKGHSVELRHGDDIIFGLKEARPFSHP